MNWKVAGQAGEGIAVTGTIFAKTCIRHGLWSFAYGEYPSLIRGGHNTMQVSASTNPVSCQQKLLDVMVALNEDAIALHLDEFTKKTVIIVDKKNTKLNWEKYALSSTIFDLPMHAISLETTGSSLAENMVALGASCALLGLDLAVLKDVIKDAFHKKGEAVVAKDESAAEKGYAYTKEQGLARAETIAPHPNNQILLSGNDAIGLGALAAGVQFYAAYPMTPTSSILHFMAENETRFPLVVKHAEDEISAINQAIGASYAGVRAMVGTSGGGFALMVEAVSLAGIAETPLVVVEGQRPGPATGLPTWTCQADLQFVMRAGHGEFPKVVLAPGDIEECFSIARLAFVLAEKFHTQVFILGDKYVLESAQSIVRPAEDWTNTRYSLAQETLPEDNSYKRFAVTPEGFSPRSLPGQPHGLQLTNSYEHDEHGYATEDGAMTKAMVEKRLRKIDAILPFIPKPQLLGPQDAEITFVEWGSTKLVIQEVLRQLNTTHPNTANAIHLHGLMPFPADAFAELAKRAKRLVMIEGNATRQCEMYIREQTGITMRERINRYDGRPFFAEDIVDWVENQKKETKTL
ncbi:MAG TPA: 2-oxoacid:acceptor oxidoreductase subunit alpha [Candidatus Pacebacteria bacterium]|nr:MAG: 2-oxoglutarate ferredoxin oxidoreductase alpha subunit [Microgenomates group bacterium GW2011_GWB1_45_17]KKU23559.1 MAG: 2-oxoglutarate ferredoxin oxidoreductase alpha subunit [Microgenomates group bacterium GW2011_GWC1_46_15]HAV14896.1 2-oxoacid:acceptor oxidoreductase subunit alpha [Candidatus Paceibacterota bacterium]HCR11354.1 2-oxoacid:acceptor oxidoreductase subunit alpha [Candidatus Paceibacterota bacterium]